MRVASVCSSVGGLDLGLHRAGHETVFLCEFDAWRRTVLARHWPGVPQHHDLKELRASDIPPCDLFVGGTPCQDLSVAGRRAGLDGERSGLFHAFAQLRLDLHALHGCAWSLWENVAGALSSNDGRDFATVLASHVGADVPVPAAGWRGAGLVAGPWGTAEWRLLDAQFFGVPQRRRRVFVVGHLGAVDPVEVLADEAGRRRHPASCGEARPHAATGPARSARVAGSLTARYRKGVDSDAGDGQLVTRSFALRGREGGAQVELDPIGVVSSLRAAPGGSSRPYVAHTLTGHGYDASEDGSGRGTPIVADTLRTHPRPGSNSVGAVAFHMTQDPISGPVSPSIGENAYIGAQTQQGVRRLTPTECERLMGWPDGWTLDQGPSLIDAPQGWPGGDPPNDPQPDGRRYSACGDGVVAHVAEWIGLGFPEFGRQQEVPDA